MPPPGRPSPGTWPAAWTRFRRGRLQVRRNLHLGVGFLAATVGGGGPGRLRFRRIQTETGAFSIIEAGDGPPILMLHGLGGTKASFLPTIAALAPSLPHDRRGHARLRRLRQAARRLLRPRVPGRAIAPCWTRSSSSGRTSSATAWAAAWRWSSAFCTQSGSDGLVLMTPAMAWLRDRRWAPYLRLVRPELGLIQIAPRAVGRARRAADGPGSRLAVGRIGDRRVRARLRDRPRAGSVLCRRPEHLPGRAARRRRLLARLRELRPESLFIWGRHDRLVPTGFMQHVERGPAGGAPRRAELRPYPADRAPARDARRHCPVPRPKVARVGVPATLPLGLHIYRAVSCLPHNLLYRRSSATWMLYRRSSIAI